MVSATCVYFYYEIVKTSPAILILIMEEVNYIQDHSLDSSKPDNENRQEESADWDFEEDITDLLQLDDIIAEGPVIDESSNQSCKGDLGNKISQIVNTHENKTDQSKDSKENMEDDLMHTLSQKKNCLKIKIRNNKCRVDEIRCDPYNIEDVDLIEVQKDSKNSEEKEERFAIMESVRNRKKKKREKIENAEEKEIKAFYKYEVSEERRGVQFMSIEEADKIFKALVDNICEKNDQDVRLQCKSCGFYSENIQERIEHLNGARHAAVREVRNAIRVGILENYSTNTFYCTICSWFITDISSIIEHFLSSRHKDAELISRYKMPGVLRESFCNNCKCILRSNKKIYNHMAVEKHDSINYYFIQCKKHVIIKMNKKKEVYCHICNCYVSVDNIIEHLENHEKVCYNFNMGNQIKCLKYGNKECKWHHKCGTCRGDHPQIKCSLKREKNIIPVLGHEKSKFGLQHENEMIMSKDSYKKLERNDKFSESVKNFDREIFRNNTHDSSIPGNAYVSKVQKNLPTRHYEHNEDEYESNASKQITKSNIQARNSYPDENDRIAYKSNQGSNLSRSPTKDYSSKGSSHKTNNIDISKSSSINGRYPKNEYSPRRHLSQSRNMIEVITNVHSGDKYGEFNLITAIVKLLEICDLLGNLGYFFANTLKKALEKKESKEDILNILREHANIILMEVIFKKLEACKRVYDMEPYIKIKSGIRYLTYLIDASKNSQLRNT